MIFDPLYLILIAPVFVFALWASAKTKSTFTKFSKVGSRVGLTGAQVARKLLDADRLTDVTIERIPGQLSDHYDPKTRVLRLSESVHDGTSLAAIGVAAHEMGHAMQHADAYKPLVFRQAFYPVAAFSSSAWVWLFLGGMFLPSLRGPLMIAAIVALSLYAFFALVTLPVEYDASNRALAILEGSGTLSSEEIGGASKVLRAAGLTYVASAAMALMQVLYLVMRARE